MRIYLAARYGRHVELETCAADLRFDGHEVTSRWHKGEHQALDEDLVSNPLIAERFAKEDYRDLLDAELCISFTETPRSSASRGGRHVEFGIAHAQGRRCWIVGPAENVFHHLPDVVHFANWPEVIRQLREDAADA